jgi:trk/ktr system potassium uptake protein
MTKKNHEREFAVIGLGRFGGSLAQRLEELGQAVLGIDLDPLKSKEIANKITETVVLDAADPDALQQVDITSFKTVIVAIEEDFETNALITTSLKELGIPHVICVSSSQRHRDILLRVGADRVVIPKEESGIQLADELSTPGLLYRLPLSSDYSLIEIKTPPGLVMKKVEESDRYQVYILLIMRGDELILSPDHDVQFHQDDLLIAVGEKQHLVEFSALT